eukprot:1155425-Prymnesium_polylepis.1
MYVAGSGPGSGSGLGSGLADVRGRIRVRVRVRIRRCTWQAANGKSTILPGWHSILTARPTLNTNCQADTQY